MKQVIAEFINKNNQAYQRYNSWNHCYNAFKTSNDIDFLSLHLGFYLASWGMYRGSSVLLERDYLVHKEPIKLLKKFGFLHADNIYAFNEEYVKNVQVLINELSKHYKIKHGVTPTDTLISKIILGTLGCLPAFDRFFINGVKSENRRFKTLKPASIKELTVYVENNQEIRQIQEKHPQYPIMKIVDMYFWQLGYNLDSKK